MSYYVLFGSCFFFFSVLLALRLPRLGKRELILVLFVRLFGLCLFGFVRFRFLLESGKGCGLWLWHSLDFSLTFSCQKVCEALVYCLDIFFIRFRTKRYRQAFGIPKGTNCALLVADLFLFCYERDFMKPLSRENQADLLYVFPCVILFLCFSVLLVLRLPRLGKSELILVLFVRLFDLCLFGFVSFLFPLGSGKGCGLWLWLSLDFSLTFFWYFLGF